MRSKLIAFPLTVLTVFSFLAGCKKNEVQAPECQNGGTPISGASYCDCPEGYMLPDCELQARDPFIGQFTVTFEDNGQNQLNNPYIFTISKNPDDIWWIYVTADKPPFDDIFSGEVDYSQWDDSPYVRLYSSSYVGNISVNTFAKSVYNIHFDSFPVDEYQGMMIRQ